MKRNIFKQVISILVMVLVPAILFAQVKGVDTNPSSPKNPWYNQVNAHRDALCQSPGAAIPDNDPGGVSDTMIISGQSGTVIDLDVSIDITHTWVGDIEVTLEHVDSGTTVTLIDRPGVPASTFGCSGNNYSVLLDDEAGSAVEDECGAGDPSINGPFTPAGNLSDFDGVDPNGTWVLTVYDHGGGDTGTLDDWCLISDELALPGASQVPTLGEYGLMGLVALFALVGVWFIRRRN